MSISTSNLLITSQMPSPATGLGQSGSRASQASSTTARDSSQSTQSDSTDFQPLDFPQAASPEVSALRKAAMSGKTVPPGSVVNIVV
ncbi:MAG: hypothetical protein WCD42_13360 [Rhizomicrobium sp.]